MNAAVYIVLGAVLLLGGKWEMPAIFQKQPPTKQLAAAQEQLDAAKAAQAAAEAKLAAAEADRQAKLAAQLDYTQQMSLGTDLALQRIPLEQRSPEVKIAAEFSGRAVAGFETARGKLSPQQRAEIEGLFNAALAAKDSEVATLRKSLEQKDVELQTATQQKRDLEVKVIPGLKQDLTTAQAATTVVEARVEAITAKIVTYANETAAEKAKNGSLDAYAGNLVRILVALALLYALIHFGLPSLAQEFPASGWLQTLNKTAKSISSAHL